MKHLFFILAIISSHCIANEENVTLSFDRINIPQLIELVYSDILEKSYIIDDDVLKKTENTTIRLKSNFKKSELESIMQNMLNKYSIEIEKGKNHIFFKLGEKKSEAQQTFYYKPKYRSTGYLVSMVAPMMEKGSVSNKREVDSKASKSVDDKGVNKLIDKDSDGLLFVGTAAKIIILKHLLEEIDTPEKQVNIQAFVYEVQNTSGDSNALQTVLKIVKNSSAISITAGASRSAGQTFEVSTKGLDILLNIFNNDNRFNVITSPSMLVRNKQKSRFSVGTETPILGGINFPNDGKSTTPLQAVEYRPSGTIFEVTPTIHENNIELALTQEISNFVQTTTGVSNSPTLITRKLNTSFSIKSGQMIVMAGLKEAKNSNDSTYLPFTKFEIGHEENKSKTEIVIMLYCKVIEDGQKQDAPLNFNEFLADLPTGEIQ
jgi:general secretion pathway protein D